MQTWSRLVGVMVICTLLGACGFPVSSTTDDDRPPERETVPVAPQKLVEPAVVIPWSCFYEPTYDDNWHDDVLCTNGIDFRRPSLREWDDFVTEGEIMESAAEYENELNG